MVTAVFPIESPLETREARQPVHRETRDVGVQISGTHTDECTSSRPGDWVIPDACAMEGSSSQSVSEGEGSAWSERKAIYYDRCQMGDGRERVRSGGRGAGGRWE